MSWNMKDLEVVEKHYMLVWADCMFLFVTYELEENRRIGEFVASFG